MIRPSVAGRPPAGFHLTLRAQGTQTGFGPQASDLGAVTC